MDDPELRKEYERLLRNYSKAAEESMKCAASEPLQPGVPTPEVPFDELKAVYDHEIQSKKELEEFRSKNPGIY